MSRGWHKALDGLIVALSVAMVLFHVLNILKPTLPPVPAANVHLIFGILLVYLGSLRVARDWRESGWLLALLAVGLAVTGYVAFNYETLEDRIGLATPLDTVVGVALIAIVLEATRRTFGRAIPAVAIAMLLYAYFGNYMPGVFHHTGFSLVRLIGNVTTYLTGVFGSLLQISSTTIAIFMLFGGFLGSSGASNYFVKLALRLGQGLSSGPALAAVAASALFGSVNGSPVANVSTTGIFTIPLMKRHGYSAKFAAATEAVASTGGTLMPPIMGVAAFLMSSITGVPYIEIAGHALIPGIIYFLGVGMAVHIRSLRLGLKPAPLVVNEDPRGTSLLEGTTFFVPFALIIGLMMQRYPVAYAALMGLLALAGLMLARSAVYALGWLPAPLPESPTAGTQGEVPQTAPTLVGQLLNGALEGAQGAARIAVVCATLGIVIHAFTMTGLAGRIVHNMAALSGGYLINAMLIVAGVALLFGLGVPTAGSYVIVAILGAPILTGMDVPVVAAHLFVLYFTMLSALTPPVGATVLVASQIARAGYWDSAVVSISIALPGFIVPFLYVLEPGILAIGPMEVILTTVIAVAAGVYALTGTLEGYLLAPCRPLERLALAVAAGGLLAGGVVGDWLSAIGAVPLVVVGALQFQRRRLTPSASTT